MLIVLQGPYRAFDARYMAAARALSASTPQRLAAGEAAAAEGAAAHRGGHRLRRVDRAVRAGTAHRRRALQHAADGGGDARLRRQPAAHRRLCAGARLPPLLAFLLAALLGRPRWR